MEALRLIPHPEQEPHMWLLFFYFNILINLINEYFNSFILTIFSILYFHCVKNFKHTGS